MSVINNSTDSPAMSLDSLQSDAQSNGRTFKDFGGMDGAMDEVLELAALIHQPALQTFAAQFMSFRSVLLCGPRGSGKTELVRALANETRSPLYECQVQDLLFPTDPGESIRKITQLLSEASSTGQKAIVFIDNIEKIGSQHETYLFMRRLIGCADKICNPKCCFIALVGATNRPELYNPDGKKFDSQIFIGVPNEVERLKILSLLTSKVKTESSIDLAGIAKSTRSYVGADLEALVNKADHIAKQRGAMNQGNLGITTEDLEEAVKEVEPCFLRERYFVKPNVQWDEVGGLESIKEEFDEYIVSSIQDPESFKVFGVCPPKGILLIGPPGCGKRQIIEAVANKSGANFMHVQCLELLIDDGYYEVKGIFNRARLFSPCVIFFDELDALVSSQGFAGLDSRVLNQVQVLDDGRHIHGVIVLILRQLMEELNKDEKAINCVVAIAATHRDDLVGHYAFREFKKHLYVNL